MIAVITPMRRIKRKKSEPNKAFSEKLSWVMLLYMGRNRITKRSERIIDIPVRKMDSPKN